MLIFHSMQGQRKEEDKRGNELAWAGFLVGIATG